MSASARRAERMEDNRWLVTTQVARVQGSGFRKEAVARIRSPLDPNVRAGGWRKRWRLPF